MCRLLAIEFTRMEWIKRKRSTALNFFFLLSNFVYLSVSTIRRCSIASVIKKKIIFADGKCYSLLLTPFSRNETLSFFFIVQADKVNYFSFFATQKILKYLQLNRFFFSRSDLFQLLPLFTPIDQPNETECWIIQRNKPKKKNSTQNQRNEK